MASPFRSSRSKASASMSDPLFDVRGRTVLITGATSGIGLHLTGMFLERGAHVVAAGRSAESSSPLAALREQFGGAILPIAMDVTDNASCRSAVTQILELAPVDVLVNNAGVSSEQAFTAQDDGEWQRTIEANLAGPVRVSSAIAAHLVENGATGSIVNVLSVAAFRSTRNLGAYSASKAGLGQVTRSMALELAPHGVRVNAIVPGYIETPMNREYLAGSGGERTLKRIPMGRVGSPADLDGAVIFLASDASAYVTGASIVVDGGYLA